MIQSNIKIETCPTKKQIKERSLKRTQTLQDIKKKLKEDLHYKKQEIEREIQLYRDIKQDYQRELDEKVKYLYMVCGLSSYAIERELIHYSHYDIKSSIKRQRLTEL